MLGYKFVRALICGVALLHLYGFVVAQTVDKPRSLNGTVITLQPKNTSASLDTRPSASNTTRTNEQLIEKVQRVLDKYYDRPPNTRDDSPWILLHWSIAYGIDAQVRTGGPRGDQVSAIGWLCENRPSAGTRLMSLSGDGLHLPISAGKQGHPGQFLAMLAQSRVQADFGIRVGNRQLTVADLVMHEKTTCRAGTELTFKLIGVAHYSSTEDTWTNNRGEQWSVRKLLDEELRQPITSRSTCGGTHRLFALSYAVLCRRTERLPIDGPWERAARRAQEYQARAFWLQNDDGSFSTAWFDRKESSVSKIRRLTTSGHVAEWLAFSLPDERLNDERFERCLNYVTNLLESSQASSTDWGALTHALHALAIYEQRVLGVSPGQRRRPWLEASAVKPLGRDTSQLRRDFERLVYGDQSGSSGTQNVTRTNQW
jgi:hypothetical protein